MPRGVVVRRLGPWQQGLELAAELPPLEPLPSGTLKVRVVCAGVTFPDLLQVAGKYQERYEPPFVPAMQLAGDVLAVGPGAAPGQDWRVGDRVAGWAVPGPQGGLCGGLAEEALVDAEKSWKLSSGVSYEAGVALVGSYGDAHHAVAHVGQLRAGETLLVLGAAGGAGMAAMDLAKAVGAKVVACVSSASKAEACRRAGADVAVEYGLDGSGLIPALKEAKVYGHVSAIFDPVGGRYAEDAFRALAPGGRHIVFGFAAGGEDPKSAFPKLPINLLLMREQKILGALNTSAESLEERHQLMDMVASGRLRPRVGATYPLERFGDAFEDLSTRRSVGSVIISVQPPAGERAKL